MTADEVRDILRLAQLPISLERPIGEEEDSELGDFVEDENSPSPFVTATTSLRCQDIEHALDSLPGARAARHRDALRPQRPVAADARGGGRAFGVTRERIRQIENTTLRRLETLPESQGLRDATV